VGKKHEPRRGNAGAAGSNKEPRPKQAADGGGKRKETIQIDTDDEEEGGHRAVQKNINKKAKEAESHVGDGGGGGVAATPSVGMQVRVQNLISAAQYDGQIAAIKDLRADGRFAVTLDNLGGKEISIKPQNMAAASTRPLQGASAGVLGATAAGGGGGGGRKDGSAAAARAAAGNGGGIEHGDKVRVLSCQQTVENAFKLKSCDVKWQVMQCIGVRVHESRACERTSAFACVRMLYVCECWRASVLSSDDTISPGCQEKVPGDGGRGGGSAKQVGACYAPSWCHQVRVVGFWCCRDFAKSRVFG